MRAFQNSVLTVTTKLDEVTGEEKPLFAFDVGLVAASDSAEARPELATPHGSTYTVQYRDDVTGEVFAKDDLVHGVRTGDSFSVVSEDDLAAINEATKLPDIRVERSVPLSEVPFDRVNGKYFLQVPSKSGGHLAYRLTYEALLEQAPKGKAKARPALAFRVRYTSRSRQKTGIVYADPEAQALVLLTLTFAAKLRSPDEAVLAPQAVEVEAAKVAKARKVFEGLDVAARGDFDSPVDEAVEQKRELVESVAGGEAVPVADTPLVEVTKADALEDALEASLAAV